MAILNTERLETISDELVAAIDSLDVLGNLPPEWAKPLRILAMMGFDLPGRVKAEVRSSVARLPAAARSDTARADRLAAWLVHLAAWLTDQTDVPPGPLELEPLPAPSPESAAAIASPSSARPDPARAS
jgi:hypothetical protein